MKAGFRTIDDWKSAMMDLPDNSFFELLRAVFGNIKTPFNKQRLFEDLFTLLSRNEIRKTISAYIDEGDHKIIAALALLNNPVQEELEAFFDGEFSAAELHGIVINLEERLIVYRFRERGILRLSLNPVLEKVLKPFIDDPGILFPVEKNKDNETHREDRQTEEYSPSAYITETRQMAALFAFLLNEEDLFKQEGMGNSFMELRKKVLDEGRKIFPHLDLDLALNTLLRLELVQTYGSRLISDRKRIAAYCGLSFETRQDYWSAALYLCLDENAADQKNQERFNELFSRSYRNRLRNIAGFFHRFKGIINPGNIYPETTLRRLTELLDTEDEKPAWGSALFDERIKLRFEPFLQALEKTGLLEKTPSPRPDQRGCFFKAGPSAKAPEEAVPKENPEGPVIVMDTAFSFILYPEISMADALALVDFCTVKDSAASLVISRESAVRGFDQGIGAEPMLALLDRLSGKRIDSNLGWALREWESRYAEVSLNQGVILTLAEDRRYLAEAGPISSLIQGTLAPGVYLLSSREKSEAAQALRKAGVDIIAQAPPGSPAPGSVDQAGLEQFKGPANIFPSIAVPEIAEPLLSFMDAPQGNSPRGSSPRGNSPQTSPEEAESTRQRFRLKLEKMKLSKPERDELGARIERGLVLSEAQLEGSSVRYEKLEARGLDYAGKTSIAKQAAENNFLLEVFWPGQRGETNQSTGIAQTMEKKGSESILVLKEPDTGNTIRIPLEKISLIRRIKQSIFKE